MQEVQTRPIKFKVARAIKLEPGLVLRPGVYTGTKTRTRVDSSGGVSWTPSQYKLEFSVDQLTSMGAQFKIKAHRKEYRRDQVCAPGEGDCRLNALAWPDPYPVKLRGKLGPATQSNAAINCVRYKLA